jgi:hypothetical protein
MSHVPAEGALVPVGQQGKPGVRSAPVGVDRVRFEVHALSVLLQSGRGRNKTTCRLASRARARGIGDVGEGCPESESERQRRGRRVVVEKVALYVLISFSSFLSRHRCEAYLLAHAINKPSPSHQGMIPCTLAY